MQADTFRFSWQNINVKVSKKSKTFWKTTAENKQILYDVSGYARNGSLLAIMGNSGSGKTTFLNAISGRHKNKTGFLKINTSSVSDENLKSLSGYVPQVDIFSEYLTVSEHLRFMVALISKSVTNDIKQKTLDLLADFQLDKIKTTLIKNLSGGEKRRLSLAGELLGDPLIIFCDEPTTGLDSYNAVVVVQKLKELALSGKIVLTTIHQPSSQLFNYFTTVILLSEGRLVFQGSKEEINLLFKTVDLICPANYNLAEFYINCINQEGVKEKIKTLTITNNVHGNISNNFDFVSFRKENKHQLLQLKWLLWRCCIISKRNSKFHFAIYFIFVVEIVLIGLFYSEVRINENHSVQNIEGFLSFFGTEMCFTNMYSVINVFPGELAVYLREKELYSSHIYFISKILSLVPLTMLSTAIYMFIMFQFVNFLSGFYLWLRMSFMMFMVGMASCGLGLAFSALFSTVEQTEMYLFLTEFLLLLFSGILVKLTSVPNMFNWIKYLSPFYYSFTTLSNIFWKNDISNCSISYPNGTQVLDFYGINENFDTIMYNSLFLSLLMLILCLIGFVGVYRKQKFYNI